MTQNFNTSYVSVQGENNAYAEGSRRAFQYILCVGSREELKPIKEAIGKFQYILCVGSRSHKSKDVTDPN